MSGYAPGVIAEPSLAVIAALMHRILDQNAVLVEQTADIQQRVAQLESRRGGRSNESNRSFHRRVAVGAAVAADAAEHGSQWRCPVCLQPLMHAESFKGHVRKMLPGNISTRPKCRLSSANELHIALAQRFAGASFDEKAQSFNLEFYNFVRNAINSSYTAEQSLDLITLWLEAAVAHDDRPFPAVPRVSSSDHPKRGRFDDSSS